MWQILNLEEKRNLFFRACENAKNKNLKGEAFLDEVYSFIIDTYDRIDNVNGLTMNEQWVFDDYANKWLAEFEKRQK